MLKLPPLLGRSAFPDPLGSALEHLPPVPIPLRPPSPPCACPQGCSPGRSPPRRAPSLPDGEPPATATMRRARRSPARPAAPPSSRPRWSAPSRPTPEGGPRRCARGAAAGEAGGERLQGGGRLGGGSGTCGILSIIGDECCFLVSREEVKAFLLGGGSRRFVPVVWRGPTLHPALPPASPPQLQGSLRGAGRCLPQQPNLRRR